MHLEWDVDGSVRIPLDVGDFRVGDAAKPEIDLRLNVVQHRFLGACGLRALPVRRNQGALGVDVLADTRPRAVERLEELRIRREKIAAQAGFEVQNIGLYHPDLRQLGQRLPPLLGRSQVPLDAKDDDDADEQHEKPGGRLTANNLRPQIHRSPLIVHYSSSVNTIITYIHIHP